MTETNDAGIGQAAATLRGASNICVLTGAGVSAESGVPTFRDAGGLWEGHSLEDVATPEGFHRNPKLVWRFYNERRAKLGQVKPNPGHHALAELEARARAFALITQNVDGLHQLAGSRNVIEIHGSLNIVRCTACQAQRNAAGEALSDLPTCGECGGVLRPGVVWFGEALPTRELEATQSAIEACDVMLVAGTSGVVQPAASFSSWAAHRGATIIEVNPDPKAFSRVCDIGLLGPSGQILPAVVGAM